MLSANFLFDLKSTSTCANIELNQIKSNQIELVQQGTEIQQKSKNNPIIYSKYGMPNDQIY